MNAEEWWSIAGSLGALLITLGIALFLALRKRIGFRTLVLAPIMLGLALVVIAIIYMFIAGPPPH